LVEQTFVDHHQSNDFLSINIGRTIFCRSTLAEQPFVDHHWSNEHSCPKRLLDDFQKKALLTSRQKESRREPTFLFKGFQTPKMATKIRSYDRELQRPEL
jgi:hypothetical protein